MLFVLIIIYSNIPSRFSIIQYYYSLFSNPSDRFCEGFIRLIGSRFEWFIKRLSLKTFIFIMS